MDSVNDLEKKSVDYRDENNNIVYKSEIRLPDQPFEDVASNHPEVTN
jgi:hypothetical protein